MFDLQPADEIWKPPNIVKKGDCSYSLLSRKVKAQKIRERKKILIQKGKKMPA